MTCRPTLGASPHPSKSCPRMIRDYGRDRLWAGATPIAGDSCHWCSFTLPSVPSDGMLPNSPAPIPRQRPAQRDVPVTMSRTALTDTPPSETHTSPPGIRRSPTPHQRDMSVTAPHENSRQHPAPRDTSVTNPHSPLTGTIPERHVRRQPAHASRQRRTEPASFSLRHMTKRGRTGRSHDG